MDASMSMQDVVNQIGNLQKSGESLSKKKIKQTNPQLMQNALYYFPSWEHALQSATDIQ